MGLVPIDNPEDPRLDRYRDLKRTDHRHAAREDSTFIVEGEKLVRRLFASGLTVQSVVLTESAWAELAPVVPTDVSVYVLSTTAVAVLVGFKFHRGVLACGVRPRMLTPLELFSDRLQGESPLLVGCPQLRDPDNLGAIARTSLAFGAAGLIVGAAGTDPLTRRTLRTSMGALLELPLAQTDDWPVTIRAAHELGYRTLATVLREDAVCLESIPVDEAVRTPLMVLLGNEDTGLPAGIVDLCTIKLRMPMSPRVDSLNVAVAAGVVLHHFRRV